MSKEIKLSRGHVAIVDDADHELLSNYTWWGLEEPDGRVYAGCKMPQHGLAIVRMHRFLMGQVPCDGRQTDHVNGNTLDNRRENLRECSTSQNIRNSRKQSSRSTSSRYKGVSWHARNNKWIARVQTTIDGKLKHIHLGYFRDEALAARAYNDGARKLFGDFARLNVIG